MLRIYTSVYHHYYLYIQVNDLVIAHLKALNDLSTKIPGLMSALMMIPFWFQLDLDVFVQIFNKTITMICFMFMHT